jgi:hypothetical protein
MGKWIDTKMLIIKLKAALATCSKSPEQFQHIMCITSEAKLYIRNKTQNGKNDSPIQNKTKQAYLILGGGFETANV